MLSLSPSFTKRCADTLETVARAPLFPIVDRQTPRNLSALPSSVRALPADLQVVELANMLADARNHIADWQRRFAEERDSHVNTAKKLTLMTSYRDKATDKMLAFVNLAIKHGIPYKEINETLSC